MDAMSKMGIDCEFSMGVGKYHNDNRLCYLESVEESEDPRFPEVLAKCACGRSKDFYAAEVEDLRLQRWSHLEVPQGVCEDFQLQTRHSL